MNINKFIGIVALLSTASVQANIVQNGSFENGNFVNTSSNFMQVNPSDTSLSGWTVINEHIAWGLSAIGFPASDGVGLVDLSGFGAQSPNGSIQQSLTTVLGTEYIISIDRQGGLSNVLIDGVGLSLTSGAISGAWTTFTGTFTATSASSLLSINNGAPGNPIVFVDNVSVVSAVPVPAAAWLFGSGLIGLIGLSRRK